MNVLEDCIILLIWATWVLFNFYLEQNKGFQSGALLNVPPSTPSMMEFGLHIHKQISLN